MTNIFLSFVGISVSTSLVVVVLLLLTSFLNKRYAAKWKYLIWIFLAFRLLIPFGGANGRLAADMLSRTNTGASPESEVSDRDIPADGAMPSGRIIVEIPVQMTAPITVPSGKNNMDITMLDMGAFVWMAGSLIVLFVHFISYCHYKGQVIKRGRTIDDTRILSPMFKLKRELQIPRSIQVIEFSQAGSPMIIGFFKPVLVLPKERYSPEELFFILKHELVHLKRGDVYFKLLFVTASAVHWFNPFIWIMQKEAAVDMELSCDERVTQGANYAARKAYTETLLSMLHKRCDRRTVLSTQFYGGTKIMKKRFKNILRKNRKRNGIFILILAVALTMGFGALIGCSIAKEDTRKEDTGTENRGREDVENVPDQSERAEIQVEQMPVAPSSADHNPWENTIMLTFSKEGEEERKQAGLATGDGYSFFLPDNEWQQAGSDTWTAAVNEQVRLWVTRYEEKAMDSVDQELTDNGYVTAGDYHKRKQEGDLIYHVLLKESEHDVWCVFYCYPSDSEEGWGRELPVIADTFALSAGARDEREVLTEGDCQEIRNVVDEFAAAFFGGDRDSVRRFLADTYEGEVDLYQGPGVISDLTVKGLSEADEKKIDNGRCVVSLEFRDSSYEDMFLYLTFVFARQEDGWKIQSYGVEG